jgi:hypothetical protein
LRGNADQSGLGFGRGGLAAWCVPASAAGVDVIAVQATTNATGIEPKRDRSRMCDENTVPA